MNTRPRAKSDHGDLLLASTVHHALVGEPEAADEGPPPSSALRRWFFFYAPVRLTALRLPFVEQCLEAPRLIANDTPAVDPLLPLQSALHGAVVDVFHEPYAHGALEAQESEQLPARAVADVLAAVESALRWGAHTGLTHRFVSPFVIGKRQAGWCLTGFGLADGLDRVAAFVEFAKAPPPHDEVCAVRDAAERAVLPLFIAHDPFLNRMRRTVHEQDVLGFLRVAAWLLFREHEGANGRWRFRPWRVLADCDRAALLRLCATAPCPFLPPNACEAWFRRVVETERSFVDAGNVRLLAAMLGETLEASASGERSHPSEQNWGSATESPSAKGLVWRPTSIRSFDDDANGEATMPWEAFLDESEVADA